MDQLPDLVGKIRDVDVNGVSNDPVAQADLLKLARKLTAVLEGPVNRATDLVFKVSWDALSV